MYYGARLGDLLQRPECCPQDRELTYSVSRQAQGQSKGVLDRGNARDADTLG